MLREFTHLEPAADQLFRRWLGDEYFDLYLWYDSTHKLMGWQLCYGKPNAERAITWRAGHLQMQHEAIDDGESSPGRLKKSPVLHPDGPVDCREVAARFGSAIVGIEDADVRMVQRQLMNC